MKVSWSSLRAWEQCHQRHLRRLQGKTHLINDGRIFLPGTVADRVMRAWLLSDDPQPGQMEEMAEEYLRRYAEPKTPEEREEAQYVIRWRGEADRDRALVLNFVRRVVRELEPVLMEHVLPYDYHPELRFETEVGIPYLDGRIVGVTLVGGIDIVTREAPDLYAHYDLKATEDTSYPQKVLGQLIFYSLAFGHYIGRTDQPRKSAFIAPVLPEKIVRATITAEDQAYMMSRIIAFCHGTWRRDWEPKRGDCYGCDTKLACDLYAVQAAVDAQGRHVALLEATARRRRTWKVDEEADAGRDGAAAEAQGAVGGPAGEEGAAPGGGGRGASPTGGGRGGAAEAGGGDARAGASTPGGD